MGTVYSDLKMFHYKDKLDSLPRCEAITSPIYIRWKPTNRCNHGCSYCAYRSDNLQLGKNMSEKDETPKEKMLETAKCLVDMGVKAVTFSGGGEPLLHPDLLETAGILHDGGIKLACLTNGAMLKGEIAEFFSTNATWVRVSMDGWNDESYTRYRHVKDGEYTRIMQNMKDFVGMGGKCVLGVSLIVNAENSVYVYDALERLKDIGVHSVKVSVCIVSNDAAENNAYHAPHFDLVAEQVSRAFKSLADETFEIVDAWHTMDELFENNYDWCPFSQVLAVIAADLGVYPCQDKAYNDKARLGSLKNQSFKEFWETGKDAFFRLNPSNDCKHHCVASKKNKMILSYLDIDREHLEFV